MKKSYEIATGPKQKCRDILCDRAEEFLSTPPKRIFTLPGVEALCIKTFRARFPHLQNIVGIEDKPKECAKINAMGIDCDNQNVKDYVASKTAKGLPFDIVFLDFYRHMSAKMVEDIEAFISNKNIIEPGRPLVLGLTLSKPIRHDSEEANLLMRDNLYRGHRRDVQNTLDDVGASISNMIACMPVEPAEVRLMDAVEYQAQEGSGMMYFFCFVITV